jgi:hypothetical protein
MSGEASGTSGASSGYLLTGKSDDLRKYVGQRVEVRGRLDNNQGEMGSSSGSSMGSAGSTGTGSTTGSSAGSTTGSSSTGSTSSSSGMGSSSSMSDTSNLPKLHVQSVRAIEGSCSGGQR